MLTKYFTRDINTQKYNKDVFSPVSHLSLSGFNGMFEAVRETGTSPAEKAERQRKRSQSIYAPILRVLS